MKIFILYWKTGQKETIRGETIAQAFTLAGYSTGAIRAVDFFSTNPDETYTWNERTRQWERTWKQNAAK